MGDAAKMESAFSAATASPSGMQDFLEASPYTDQSGVPINTYKNKAPHTKPGDEVKLTGPSGKVMGIPESTPNADLIMVATGTGIAPYRSFIRRLFVEKTPFAADYKGLAWLFLGVANSDALLYDDEWQPIVKNFPDNFKLDYALSREQKNKAGGKMYIQDKVGEYADEVFTRMDNGGHMYFCGLKGMMPGILEMLDGVSKEKGIVWEDKLKEWKKNGQWHVEVY